MNLSLIVQEKLDGLISSGAVDKIIETQLSKTIEKIMSDVFSEYSEFGKQLKDVFSKKLGLSLNAINVDTYSAMVCKVIEDTLNATPLAGAAEKIKKQVSQVLELLDKKEWRLSEIISKFRGGLFGDNRKVKFNAEESSYGSTYIMIGEDDGIDRRHNEYDYTIYADKNKRIFSVSAKGVKLDPTIEKPHRNEVFLMQLWANECTIIIDEDESEYECDPRYHD